MNIISALLSPVTVYLELTVAEPCQAIREAHRSKKVYARKRRFSLMSLLKRQRTASSPAEENTPFMHVASVTEHYYRDFCDLH